MAVIPTRESMVETKPQGSLDGEGVFLSPRVVDEAAFERFSETLRSIVRDAGRVGATLRDATRRAAELRDGGALPDTSDIEATIGRLADANANAAGVLRSLLGAVSEASSERSRIERVGLVATDAIEGQRRALEGFEKRVDAAVSSASERLAKAGAESARRIAEAGELAVSRIRTESESIVARTLSTLEAGAKDLEELDAEARHAVREIVATEAGEAIRSAKRDVASAVAELTPRVDEVSGRAGEAARVVRDAESACERAVTRADGLLREASKKADAHEARVRKLSAVGHVLDEDLVRSLEGLVERLEKLSPDEAEAKTNRLIRRVRTAGQRLESLCEQAGIAQASLSEAILGAVDAADRAEALAGGGDAAVDRGVEGVVEAPDSGDARPAWATRRDRDAKARRTG